MNNYTPWQRFRVIAPILVVSCLAILLALAIGGKHFMAALVPPLVFVLVTIALGFCYMSLYTAWVDPYIKHDKVLQTVVVVLPLVAYILLAVSLAVKYSYRIYDFLALYL